MQNIHVSRNGKVEGPYSLEVIREKALVGELSSADWAWWDGQTKWASLKSIPGLQFSSEDTLMDTEPQQDPGPIPCFEESQPARHLSREETSSSDTSEQTDETDRTPGITVPDFRIECFLWISAGRFWFTRLPFKAFLIHFVAFIPVLVLFISKFKAHFYTLFAGLCFAIFNVVSAWTWLWNSFATTCSNDGPLQCLLQSPLSWSVWVDQSAAFYASFIISEHSKCPANPVPFLADHPYLLLLLGKPPRG